MTHEPAPISPQPRIGFALCSGSARGWAHIGVLRALRDAGIEPDIVVGSSIGALVGAAFLCDQIEALEEGVCKLTWWDIARFMDIQVSVSRALGADVVIAVNLNGDIAGRHFATRKNHIAERRQILKEYPIVAKLLAQMPEAMQACAHTLLAANGKGNDTPGLFGVLTGSINIMQDRITRSRMADDPPDVIIAPQLAHIGLMEFDRAKEAIAEGRACVSAALDPLRACIAGAKSKT